jgi:hypothetical protein
MGGAGVQQAVPGYDGFSNTLRSLIAGGLAGSLAKTTVAPLERVKILFQVHNLPVSILQSMRHIVEKEGALALFNGNTAVVARIFPYSGVQYVAHDYFKSRLYPPRARDASALQRLTAGAGAGVSAVVCTYPLDVVRVRLACQTTHDPHVSRRYRGVVHCLMRLWRDEGGAAALYRGAVPTLIGIVPYAAINFSTYEYLKASLLSAPGCCGPTGEPAVWARLAAGAAAGSLGQTVVYPLDTVRRRMQVPLFPLTAFPALHVPQFSFLPSFSLFLSLSR